MAYRKYKLGDLVEQYDEINQNGEFTEIDDLQGINSNKYFQECKSNKNLTSKDLKFVSIE